MVFMLAYLGGHTIGNSKQMKINKEIGQMLGLISVGVGVFIMIFILIYI